MDIVTPENFATVFKDTVEQATRPVFEGPGRPIYHLPHLAAEVAVEQAGYRLEYMLFRPESVAREGGVHGLGFIPSHAVQLLGRNPFFETTTSQTMFGLNRAGHLVRSEFVTEYAQLTRELDDEESVAITNFAAAPHLNIGKLALALRLTPEEKEQSDEILARKKESDAELQEKLDAIRQNERQARIDARDVFIR